MPRILIAIALVLPVLAQAQDPGCSKPSPACIDALKQHPVKSHAYWDAAFSKPVEQRIDPAPEDVIDYITRDNILRGFPNRPQPSGLPPEFRHDVEQAFAEIPAVVRQGLEHKLAGIYFAVDFGGTGFTDSFYGTDGEERGGFVVLDSTVLSLRTANAWATWKENSPFTPETGYRLRAEIEDQPNDNRKNAIQYILLHELAHVLAIGERIHPPWSLQPGEVRSPAEYDYFSLSWAPPTGGDRYVSLFDQQFLQREHVVYYFGARLSLRDAAEVYGALEATNFPTLYAATGPGDDWAEAFASYVHSVMMGKPFRISIYERGTPIREFGLCWAEPRCAAKRRIIERFIGEPSHAP